MSKTAAVCIALAGLMISPPPARAQDAVKPFPQNRVRNFYARQAERLLSARGPIPAVLPEFPGLDGGAFGHWGQNPESNNTDNYRNTMDYGGLMSMQVDHFGASTAKGVTVHIGKNASVLFDPLRLTFVDAWKGGLIYGADRFGLGNAAKPAGARLFDLSRSAWRTPADAPRDYAGFYRHGEDVVFRYRHGGLDVLDHASLRDGVLQRTLQFDGAAKSFRLDMLPGGPGKTSLTQVAAGWHARIADGDEALAVSVRCGRGISLVDEGDKLSLVVDGSQRGAVASIAVARTKPAEAGKAFARLEALPVRDVSSLINGGPASWRDKGVVTHGELGKGAGPYVIDTLSLPYGKANPFGEPFRIGGFDFLPDGRAAVGMLSGDVWLVDGIDADLRRLRWKRIAVGLYQPLGVAVRDGVTYVTGRDQITALHDLNGDDEIDFYECVTNRFATGGGGAFVTELHADKDGSLYFFSPLSGVLKLASGAREPQLLGSGLRNTNGIGVSPDGKIVLATTQEGDWTPATGIFEVGGGSFHGYGGPKKELGKYGYRMPLCFVPRGIDHSAGGLAFVPDDRRCGPLAGGIIGTSFGNCTHYLVLRETVGTHVQGGVVPLPGEFLSGAHRVRQNPRDGQLYFAGTSGWQSYAQANGSFQRLRFAGGDVPLPTAVETRENGLVVHFNGEIDAASVNLRNVLAEQWNYLYSEAYGSPEYCVNEPGRRGHDRVDVRSVRRLKDGRSLFVEIPQLHPVLQFHLDMKLKTAAGAPFNADIYYSIFHLGKPFTDFADYAKIAKRRAPDFPIAEHYPRDARLVRQEKLGTDFRTLGGVVSLELNAVGGLMYQPLRLRVPPGERVALTFRNTDVSMPHNFVLVQPDRLQAVGEGAMMLAADPRAVANHYAPHDPGVICLSPILYGGEQYTIYFDSPTKKGAYPFVCTFPGHWKVMQGTLYVLDPQEPMPKEAPGPPPRKFVKDWTTADLAADAAKVEGRSVARGLEVFHLAGCVKCHAMAGHGAKLGPDLTDVSKRYRGEKLLRQLIDPSSEINKQYQAYVFILKDGKTFTGLVVKDEPKAVRVLPNPLKPEEITVVAKDEIDEMTASPVSTMPKGLLMTLEKEEILDLLACLEAGGKTAGHGHTRAK